MKPRSAAESAARSRYRAFISGEAVQPAARREIALALRRPAWERYRAAAFTYVQRFSRQVRRR